MGAYGAGTAKRQVGWSNDEAFMAMIIGQGGFLSKAEKDKLGHSLLTKRGVSAEGKPTFTGVRKLLKQSQFLVEHSISRPRLVHGLIWNPDATTLQLQALSAELWGQDSGSVSKSSTCFLSLLRGWVRDWLSYLDSTEVEIPGPKDPYAVDMTRTDLELFFDHLSSWDDVFEDVALSDTQS